MIAALEASWWLGVQMSQSAPGRWFPVEFRHSLRSKGVDIGSVIALLALMGEAINGSALRFRILVFGK